jgi:hypothetical protein
MSQHFALVGDDAHVKVGHQDGHALVAVGASHADVVQLAAVSKSHRTPLVNVVVTDSGFGEQRLSVEFARGLVE